MQITINCENLNDICYIEHVILCDKSIRFVSLYISYHNIYYINGIHYVFMLKK